MKTLTENPPPPQVDSTEFDPAAELLKAGIYSEDEAKRDQRRDAKRRALEEQEASSLEEQVTKAKAYTRQLARHRGNKSDRTAASDGRANTRNHNRKEAYRKYEVSSRDPEKARRHFHASRRTMKRIAKKNLASKQVAHVKRFTHQLKLAGQLDAAPREIPNKMWTAGARIMHSEASARAYLATLPEPMIERIHRVFGRSSYTVAGIECPARSLKNATDRAALAAIVTRFEGSKLSSWGAYCCSEFSQGAIALCIPKRNIEGGRYSYYSMRSTERDKFGRRRGFDHIAADEFGFSKAQPPADRVSSTERGPSGHAFNQMWFPKAFFAAGRKRHLHGKGKLAGSHIRNPELRAWVEPGWLDIEQASDDELVDMMSPNFEPKDPIPQMTDEEVEAKWRADHLSRSLSVALSQGPAPPT